MAYLSLFQDGVHKITRYNDEGLKHRENSWTSFPLEIIKRRRTAAIFSLNKDGGVFNGTMFDLVTNAQKRLIHFPQTRIESGILRTTVKWIKGGCTKIWLRICIR